MVYFISRMIIIMLNRKRAVFGVELDKKPLFVNLFGLRMLSDESFVDEDLDKSSPVRPSDRVLRSSSRSTNADRVKVKKLISNINSSNDFDKTITSNVKQISRSSHKIRLSIERCDIFF